MVPFVAACSQQSGTPTLTWYINPDNGGQKTPGGEVRDRSNGAYKITIQILPNDADAQREQLVRRLAAQRLLDRPDEPRPAVRGRVRQRRVPEASSTEPDDVAQLTDGVLAGPLKTAYWGGQLVATPFWANTQLLWFRKSAVAAAGRRPHVARPSPGTR